MCRHRLGVDDQAQELGGLRGICNRKSVVAVRERDGARPTARQRGKSHEMRLASGLVRIAKHVAENGDGRSKREERRNERGDFQKG